VSGFILFQHIKGIIDKAVSGGPHASEFGLEAKENNIFLLALIFLGNHLFESSSGNIWGVRVGNVKDLKEE